jgi:TonB family protein
MGGVMKRVGIAISLALAIPAGGFAQSSAPSPLAPSNKWMVEYADSMCVLTRDYGSGDTAVTVGFRPWPMGDQTEIIVMIDDPSTRVKAIRGEAMVTLSPSGKAIEGTYSDFMAPKFGKRLITINVKQKELTDLSTTTTVAISINGKPTFSVAPRGIGTALKALDTCDDDLLRSWGVDPHERDSIATPATAATPPRDWITEHDYPMEALVHGEQGTVAILWAIDTDGRVRKCIPEISSGNQALDKAACDAIVRRGKYHPAIGKNGKPIVSHQSRRVVWSLPG